jgi:hypothetical protein
MSYTKAGDGRVVQRGKTNVEVFPDDGPKVIQGSKGDNTPKATGKKKGGPNGQDMRKVGRNLARANNQKG